MTKDASYDLWWDSENKILRVKMYGDHDEKLAEKFVKEAQVIMDELKAKGINVNRALYDLTQAGRPSLKARLIYAKLGKQMAVKLKDPKIAYVGADLFNVTVASFIHSLAHYKIQMKFYSSMNEAVDWLKE
ncbi:hypothetical protein A2Z22_04190 [Candidatus Woesebacteria bacterium RBG_16_34_12]|uniref:STAS/SEC14 domain-containing protein n=1 Tax=Candidatus Woesebacteria bacterium RBG_16_34_12 TaxID=1802480 RepID=A0A1F7X9M8_9BACT|nr:MAG: hypothetical protein A2Z22_04190 [Candidatus Woesebacteria bacterium RBG_16_34_12]